MYCVMPAIATRSPVVARMADRTAPVVKHVAPRRVCGAKKLQNRQLRLTVCRRLQAILPVKYALRQSHDFKAIPVA